MLLLSAVLLPLGCELDRTLEGNVQAEVGIQQVGDADGPLLDEDEACETLEMALSEAKESADCDDVTIPSCPELIRPGGSLACLRYSEESVERCAQEIRDTEDCARVGRPLCVVTAVTNELTEGCVPPMAPLEAGTEADAQAPAQEAGATDGDSSIPMADAAIGMEAGSGEFGDADSGLREGADAASSMGGSSSSPADASSPPDAASNGGTDLMDSAVPTEQTDSAVAEAGL